MEIALLRGALYTARQAETVPGWFKTACARRAARFAMPQALAPERAV